MPKAVEQGFDPGTGSIDVNLPPQSGSYRDGRAVEVLLSITVPRMFTGMFITSDVAITARGVAHFDDAGMACILVLAPEAP